MGLAASQARFLGLTARKSNIEYEGQQVNQQRTALAEEVNALYNSLASLKLPIAPDASAYYQSNYTFTLGNSEELAGDYVIKNYFKNDNGKYSLEVSRTYTEQTVSGAEVNKSYARYDEASGKYYFKPDGENEVELTESSDSSTMVKLVQGAYGPSECAKDDKFYKYTDADGVMHYFSKSSLDNKSADAKLSSYTRTNKTMTQQTTLSDVQLVFDANNRISKAIVNNQSADVETVRNYDSDGYDAALRDYTMSKDEYNKKVQDLNARTESLQQEDKILEMRLDQISTEQNELKTEMEAVKKVLQDNIEQTFKTFA